MKLTKEKKAPHEQVCAVVTGCLLQPHFQYTQPFVYIKSNNHEKNIINPYGGGRV